MKEQIDYKGQKWNSLTFIRHTNIKRIHRNSYLTLFRCDCKNLRLAILSSVIRGKIKKCKACVKKSTTQGYKKVPGFYFRRLKDSAREDKRNHSFNITPKYIGELFKQQEEKCALTGVPLMFVKVYRDMPSQTASLDRIDSSIGYEENNVQWVHRIINFMKGSLSVDDFYKWAKLFVTHYERYLKNKKFNRIVPSLLR